MIKSKVHIYLLFFFVTAMILNAEVLNLEVTSLVGKYGKLIIALLGIIILQKNYILQRFVIHNKLLIGFWLLCVFFTIISLINKGFDLELLQKNLLFILFVYFIYLLSVRFLCWHKFPNLVFFKILSNTINANLLLWTCLGVFLKFSFWHSINGRIGLSLIFDSYITLGMVSCVGAIVNFSILKYKPKGRVFYLGAFLLYTFLVILSNSRNAQLILMILLVLNYFPVIKKYSNRYLYIITIFFLLTTLYFVFDDFLIKNDIVKFTTGRSRIWDYLYNYYKGSSILGGQGIFGLNEYILEMNREDNYYFQSLDTLYFHSSYLEVLAASGIFGFLIFILFLVQKFKRDMPYYKLSIVIGIAAGGFFESFLVQPTLLLSFVFWYLLISETKRSKIN